MIIILVVVVTGWTVRAVMWVDMMLSVTQREKVIVPLDNEQAEVE